LCCVFPLSVSLLLLFPLFAVLLNCRYPDPPVSACFFLFSLAPRRGEGRPRGAFVAGCSLSITGAYREDGEGLSARVCSDRTRGNGSNLKDGRFRLHIRKKFFTMRVVKHWNRLPREAVDSPSIEFFKARLDGALSNLV